MNNSVFLQTMDNVRTHRQRRNITFVTTDKRRRYLVPEPNYHTQKQWISENLLQSQMNKTKVKVNQPIDLRLKILEISKTVTSFGQDFR